MIGAIRREDQVSTQVIGAERWFQAATDAWPRSYKGPVMSKKMPYPRS